MERTLAEMIMLTKVESLNSEKLKQVTEIVAVTQTSGFSRCRNGCPARLRTFTFDPNVTSDIK